mmetsp:Transcript_657/g.776  ORF Transcript_657/g.776 Transcript_657/m.776 type:complete len:231 (-) Transcript_657:845-1537(-)
MALSLVGWLEVFRVEQGAVVVWGLSEQCVGERYAGRILTGRQTDFRLLLLFLGPLGEPGAWLRRLGEAALLEELPAVLFQVDGVGAAIDIYDPFTFPERVQSFSSLYLVVVRRYIEAAARSGLVRMELRFQALDRLLVGQPVVAELHILLLLLAPLLVVMIDFVHVREGPSVGGNTSRVASATWLVSKVLDAGKLELHFQVLLLFVFRVENSDFMAASVLRLRSPGRLDS